jgi:hypothetical protein
MGEAAIVGHELVEPCFRCGAASRGVIYQTVVGDRLAWGISSRCDRCAEGYERCEWDEMPDELRQVLIARDGLARLRGDPEVNNPLRVRLLMVFRRYGVSISEASATYARLTGAGITGTSAEMDLLGRRLAAAGAVIELDLPTQEGTADPATAGRAPSADPHGRGDA